MTVEYTAKIVRLPGQNPIETCGCHYCDLEWRNIMDDLDPDGWVSRVGRFMILCPDCGCKRCPKATYHGHGCTGSNDPGQPFSVHGGFALPNAREYPEPEWSI